MGSGLHSLLRGLSPSTNRGSGALEYMQTGLKSVPKGGGRCQQGQPISWGVRQRRDKPRAIRPFLVDCADELRVWPL